MKIREVIDYKLNLLIDLMLTDGVSPSDLANNIFLEEYVDITFHKKSEMVIAELTFHEAGTKEVRMMYSYNKQMKVQRIEECIDAKQKLLWDRSMREQEIINEILELMKASYTKSQIEKFIETLPLEIKCKLTDQCIKIA